MSYSITPGTAAERAAILDSLYGFDLVSPAAREKIATAWVTTVASSAYGRLEDVPWDVMHPAFRLIDHVNEVTRIGCRLAEVARQEWGREADMETLVSILMLHDVDKPMLFASAGGETRYSALASEIPHGVIGGMLLKELGFPHLVVSTVTTHSPRMPFPGRTFEAYVLFYADLFSCDNALLAAGKRPLYFGMEVPPA